MELAAPHSKLAGAKSNASLIRGRHARSAMEKVSSAPMGLGCFLVTGTPSGSLHVWCVSGGPSTRLVDRTMAYYTSVPAHSTPIVALVYVPPARLPDDQRAAAVFGADDETRPHDGLIVSAASDGSIKVFDALQLGLLSYIHARPSGAGGSGAAMSAPTALTSLVVPPFHGAAIQRKLASQPERPGVNDALEVRVAVWLCLCLCGCGCACACACACGCDRVCYGCLWLWLWLWSCVLWLPVPVPAPVWLLCENMVLTTVMAASSDGLPPALPYSGWLRQRRSAIMGAAQGQQPRLGCGATQAIAAGICALPHTPGGCHVGCVPQPAARPAG